MRKGGEKRGKERRRKGGRERKEEEKERKRREETANMIRTLFVPPSTASCYSQTSSTFSVHGSHSK